MAEIIFCLCVILIAVIGSGASEHDMFNSALHMNFDIICQNLNATIDGQSISNDCFEQLHESCNSSIVLETSKYSYSIFQNSHLDMYIWILLRFLFYRIIECSNYICKITLFKYPPPARI